MVVWGLKLQSNKPFWNQLKVCITYIKRMIYASSAVKVKALTATKLLTGSPVKPQSREGLVEVGWIDD